MKPRLLSPARQAELLARYPAEDTETLAADFGLTKRQVGLLASSNHIKKAASVARSGTESFSQLVRTAVAAVGAAGLSRAQAIAALPALPSTTVCHALHSLTNRGLLHRAGNRGSSRWFTLAEHALAHATTCFNTVPGVHIKPHTAPAHLPGEPIVPAGMKPTQGPTVPGPAERLAACEPGLFSNLRPGRYIDAQPKAWVAAANRKAA